MSIIDPNAVRCCATCRMWVLDSGMTGFCRNVAVQKEPKEWVKGDGLYYPVEDDPGMLRTDAHLKCDLWTHAKDKENDHLLDGSGEY